MAQWGLGPAAIAMWRCVLGSALLLLAVVVGRRPVRVPRPVMGLLALAGLAFALDLFVWHRSVVLAGAGMATILGNTQVFLTAILAAIFFRERLSMRFGLSAVCAMLGVVLLVGIGSDVAFTPDYVRGIVYGLSTGLVYALFLTLLRAAGRRAGKGSGLVHLLWFSLFAAVVLPPMAAAESGPLLPSAWQAWALLLLLALIAQSFGWWAITRSVVHVRGSVAGLVLLLQPVLATVWSALLFGETLQPPQIAGALITLLAIYAGSTRP